MSVTAAARDWRSAREWTVFSRSLLFGLYCLCVGLANLQVVGALVDLSRRDSTASHLVLIPFVSLALVGWRRREIFSSVRFAWGAGPGVILAGLACAFVAGSPTWAVASVVILLIGGFLLFYGDQAFRAARFPLGFLALMIPIPPVLLDGAVHVLKTGSAEAVAGLFTLTGMPFQRDAYVFTLPGLSIEVADACSGIRSSIALVLTALVAGHVFLRQAWKKALLALTVLPIAILKNGIRIFSLSTLATYVDPGFIVGRLHTEGGILFFLVGLALLVPLLVVLRRGEGLSRYVSQTS